MRVLCRGDQRGPLGITRLRPDGGRGHHGRHYHEKTRVYFFVQNGGVEIETRDVATGAKGRFELAGGQGVLLPEMSYHEIRFQTESDYLLLKSRAYDADDPDTFALDAET